MEYLTELNDLQLQAVTTKSKKVLVIAGAGSGKTKVLTTRIKYLLDNGIEPLSEEGFRNLKNKFYDYVFEMELPF